MISSWRLERNVAFTGRWRRSCARPATGSWSRRPVPRRSTRRSNRGRRTCASFSQLANLVPARRPDDVVELLKSQDNRKFGLTIVVSLGSKIQAGTGVNRRSIEINPHRAVSYLAGTHSLKEAGRAGSRGVPGRGKAALAARGRARPRDSRRRAEPYAGRPAAVIGLAAILLADRFGVLAWTGAAAGVAGFGAVFSMLCRRQNDAFARALDAAFVCPLSHRGSRRASPGRSPRC